MTPGTRVRMNESSAWPERVGCEGVVVDPDIFGGVYPADKPFTQRRGEVILLLDDDPLTDKDARALSTWTCVTSRKSLSVVSEETDKP